MSGQFCTVTIFFYASRFALFVLLKLMPCINATKRLCTYTPMPRESAIWPPVLCKHVFSRDFVTWDLGDWSRSPLLCTPPGHLRQQPWQRMYFYIQSICNPWLGLLKSPIMFCVYILRSHDTTCGIKNNKSTQSLISSVRVICGLCVWWMIFSSKSYSQLHKNPTKSLSSPANFIKIQPL